MNLKFSQTQKKEDYMLLLSKFEIKGCQSRSPDNAFTAPKSLRVKVKDSQSALALDL